MVNPKRRALAKCAHCHTQEEIPTGVYEYYSDESSLRSAAPSHLASGLWYPSLASQLAGGAALRHTLELQLGGDTWVTDLGEEGSASSSALLAALTSAQDEPRGWNSVVRAQLTAASLERVSDILAVITLPDAANYSIDKPETIAITIPAACVLSDESIAVGPVVASPEWARWPDLIAHPLVIDPTAGSALVTSDLTTEADLRLGSGIINLTLVDDTWADGVGEPGAAVRHMSAAHVVTCGSVR